MFFGLLFTLGCATTADIVGNSCPDDSGPVDASRQSLSARDLGGGTIAVTHTCADVNACAGDGDYQVNTDISGDRIQVDYDYNGDRCDLTLPSDLYYEIGGIGSGSWTVSGEGVTTTVTVE